MSFRQASKPAPCVLHNVHASPSRKLCQCQLEEHVLLNFPTKRISRLLPCSHLKLENPILYEVALESKFTNLENVRNSMNALCRLSVPCSGSTSSLTSTSAPAFHHVRQLSLQRIFSLCWSLLVDFPINCCITCAESSIVVGDSPQLPLSCPVVAHVRQRAANQKSTSQQSTTAPHDAIIFQAQFVELVPGPKTN